MWSFSKLVLWGLVLLMAWPFVEAYRNFTKKPRIDNCVTWACRRWDEKPDSYLVIRWCRSSRTNLKWPHFMWLDEKHHDNVKHFLPLVDQQDTHYLPDLFFEGKVVTGDDEDDVRTEN